MAAKKKEEKKSENISVFDEMIEQEFTEMQDLSKVDDTVDYYVDTGNWALNIMQSLVSISTRPIPMISRPLILGIISSSNIKS